jgi:shikimate dehydrogenase
VLSRPEESDVSGEAPDGRCGVLGSPIGHSLSPVLHRAAYAALGVAWEYDAYDVTAPQLADFVAGLGQEWRGLSLTMPLKQVAVGLCESVEPLAARLGAVNTLVQGGDGWSGHNTDVGGCVDALRGAGVTTMERGSVLGGGATAASALAALVQLGASTVDVLVRSVQRAGWLIPLGRALGADVGVHGLESDAGVTDVLVSTIPAVAQAPYADRLAASARVVFDVVYEPRVTPLLAAALRREAVVVPGVELLLHQAARQVVLMTGARTAPIEQMRAALS